MATTKKSPAKSGEPATDKKEHAANKTTKKQAEKVKKQTATKKTAYKDLDDLRKISKQWVKLSGLHNRSEWSAAVIRAATAAELAVSYAIRQEFAKQAALQVHFVDKSLEWANGIQGKFERLLKPLLNHQPEKWKVFKPLAAKIDPINRKRNLIAHGGHFCKEHEAKELIETCRGIVLTFVHAYDKDFVLKEGNPDSE